MTGLPHLELPDMGESQVDKEGTFNAVKDLLDSALTDYLELEYAAATLTHTPTAQQFREHMAMKLTEDSGSPPASGITLAMTNMTIRPTIVVNKTSQTATCSGFTVPPSAIAIFYFDEDDILGAVFASTSAIRMYNFAESANTAIGTAFNVGDTFQGEVVASGDRCLFYGQTDPIDNGGHVAGASLTRATDMDATGELNPGDLIYVMEGDNAGALYIFVDTAVPAIGTDPLTFVAISSGGPGGSGVATGLEIDATPISADSNFTLTVGTDEMVQRLTATFSATRTGTLASGAQDAAFLIFHDGSGDYDITIDSQFILRPGMFVLMTHDGTAWRVAESGFKGTVPFLIGGSYLGTPTINVKAWAQVVDRAFQLPASLTGSRGYVYTAPSGGDVDFDIRKNAGSIGTMSFANGANTATFTFSSAIDFAAGDRIDIVAPADLESAADFTWLFRGIRKA